MTDESRSRSRRRITLVAAASLVAAAGLAVLLAKTTPSVYDRTAPMGLDPGAAKRFDRRVVNHVGNVLLDESGGTRLDLTVTEAMLNARVARFLAEERRGGRQVPSAVAHLRVGFEPGVVVLATRLGDGWSRVVVAQRLHLSADEQGRLRVRPAGTRAGLLPMPAGLLAVLRQAVADALARAEAAEASENGEEPADEDDESTRVRLFEALLGALAGEPVPLGKGKHRIILESVDVERGVLRMTGRRAEP